MLISDKASIQKQKILLTNGKTVNNFEIFKFKGNKCT